MKPVPSVHMKRREVPSAVGSKFRATASLGEPDDGNSVTTNQIGPGKSIGMKKEANPGQGGLLFSSRTVPRSYSFGAGAPEDRKSTRLNSSHVKISYAVFRMKK